MNCNSQFLSRTNYISSANSHMGLLATHQAAPIIRHRAQMLLGHSDWMQPITWLPTLRAYIPAAFNWNSHILPFLL